MVVRLVPDRHRRGGERRARLSRQYAAAARGHSSVCQGATAGSADPGLLARLDVAYISMLNPEQAPGATGSWVMSRRSMYCPALSASNGAANPPSPLFKGGSRSAVSPFYVELSLPKGCFCAGDFRTRADRSAFDFEQRRRQIFSPLFKGGGTCGCFHYAGLR